MSVGESSEGYYFSLGPLVRYGLGICRRFLFSNQTKAGGDGVTASSPNGTASPLERMNEPRCPDSPKDVNADIYRIMILPTWGKSHRSQGPKAGELYSLSARRLDGQGGYDPGKLVSKGLELGARRFKVACVLNSDLNFFQLSAEDA